MYSCWLIAYYYNVRYDFIEINFLKLCCILGGDKGFQH